MIRARYVDGPFGQVHLRENTAAGTDMPLVCLHATAYSSRTFVPLLQALDETRYAMALDTPGYGESDAPPAGIGIGDYAEALAASLPARFDLFGYHSGVSIAVELAIRHPARVDRMWLMGIPYFRALDFNAWRARLSARHELGDDLAQFDERWRYLVVDRPEGLSLRRGFENFVDELKAWPNGWRAHEALFAHDLDARLPLVATPVTVINPPGHLADPSRRAAALMPLAQVIDLEKGGAVLERDADLLAALIVNASVAELRRPQNIPETTSSDRPSHVG